ncbi:MAG: hypothetical protein NTY30_02460 [Candidatus Berkelbacteria bacterium]|nr:hypothetical protein [Candidatus Berkelbacteria bacterium]
MYEESIRVLRREINRKFTGLLADDNGGKPPDVGSPDAKLAAYLLWMCDRIETFDDPRKATAWISWAQGRAEDPLRLFVNDTTRDCIRADVPGYEQAAVAYYSKCSRI